MQLQRTLLLIAFAEQTIATPLDHRHSFVIPWLSLLKRSEPPPECTDASATEEQGCFKLQDASGQDVQFALAPEQSFDGEDGNGTKGTAVHCILQNGTDIAVKQYTDENDYSAEKCKEGFSLYQELEENEHILKSLACGTVKGNPAHAMEFAADGTLSSRIESGSYTGKEKEKDMKDVASQILNGIAAMHSKQIAHGAMSEDNVVFSGDTAKITGLENACKEQACNGTMPSGPNGTASPGKRPNPASVTAHSANMDPETLKASSTVDLFANDVWTVARMFVHMTTGVAVPDTDSEEMRKIWDYDNADIRRDWILKQWPDFSDEFAELLADLFCKEPERVKMDALAEDFNEVQIYC